MTGHCGKRQSPDTLNPPCNSSGSVEQRSAKDQLDFARDRPLDQAAQWAG
jgi:hypothetical protein